MGLTFCRRKPHASTFGPCFDDHLVGAFDAPGANRPACLLIGRVLHVRFTLLQIAQSLLHGWTGTASYQPGQMFEHPVGSLVFEPVKHDLQTLGGQSASCCTYGLPNLIDVFGCARKIEKAHCICTMIVDQSLQPLRSILHCAHLCRPF